MQTEVTPFHHPAIGSEEWYEWLRRRVEAGKPWYSNNRQPYNQTKNKEDTAMQTKSFWQNGTKFSVTIEAGSLDFLRDAIRELECTLNDVDQSLWDKGMKWEENFGTSRFRVECLPNERSE